MDLKGMAEFGRECERILNEMANIKPEKPKIEMEVSWPAYAGIKEASKLFGVSYETMRQLERRYSYAEGFPSVRIGTRVLIDVPGLYEWLKERRGQKLDAGGWEELE